MNKFDKNYKICFILFAIGVFLIISGGISSLLIGLKEDRDTTLYRMGEVNQEYESFSTFVSLFEVERDNLYAKVLSNVTYEYLFVNDKDIKNKLSNYEAMVDELYKKTDKLDELCSDMYFPDSSANIVCNSYNTTYEQVNNYFVADINLYNENIKKYNEIFSIANPVLNLKKYEIDKQQIDFDEDGVILGNVK